MDLRTGENLGYDASLPGVRRKDSKNRSKTLRQAGRLNAGKGITDGVEPLTEDGEPAYEGRHNDPAWKEWREKHGEKA